MSREKDFYYEIGDIINGWEILDRFRGTRKGKTNNLVSQKMYVVKTGSKIKNTREDAITERRNKKFFHLKTAVDEIDAACNRLFRSYKRHAKDRNLEWNLTKEQFFKLTSGNCFYCDLEPLQKVYSNSKKQKPYIYNGIDRKNNKEGYYLENCVSCCSICNQAKLDLTLEEFKIWLKRISKHFQF